MGALPERPEVAFARKLISRLNRTALSVPREGAPEYRDGYKAGSVQTARNIVRVIQQEAGIDKSKSGGLATLMRGDEDVFGGAFDGDWWKYLLAAGVGIGAGYYAKKKRYF